MIAVGEPRGGGHERRAIADDGVAGTGRDESNVKRATSFCPLRARRVFAVKERRRRLAGLSLLHAPRIGVRPSVVRARADARMIVDGAAWGTKRNVEVAAMSESEIEGRAAMPFLSRFEQKGQDGGVASAVRVRSESAREKERRQRGCGPPRRAGRTRA